MLEGVGVWLLIGGSLLYEAFAHVCYAVIWALSFGQINYFVYPAKINPYGYEFIGLCLAAMCAIWGWYWVALAIAGLSILVLISIVWIGGLKALSEMERDQTING